MHMHYIILFVVHGFGSDLYEVEEGGTVEIKLERNLKGTTMFPFLVLSHWQIPIIIISSSLS